MKVSDLIPNLYNNNLEMNNIIYSEEDELENLKQNIENRFIDTFASKATEKGIQNYENIFDIKANPYTEDLNFRRERIMNRLVSSIPYSIDYLIRRLNVILGEGKWEYIMDYANYTLTISALTPGKNWYNEAIEFINKIIPVNIKWSVNTYKASWAIVKDHFTNWNAVKEKTWQQILDGEYLS